MDEVTAKFQLNASLLSAFSPSLAAHHASRARRTAAANTYALALSPLHCPRCAHLPVATRVIAKQRRTRTKKTMHSLHAQGRHSPTRGPRIYKSCAACGYVGDEDAERKEGGRDLVSDVLRADAPLPQSEALLAPLTSLKSSAAASKVPETALSTINSKGKARASVSVSTPVSRSSSPSVPVPSATTNYTSNLAQSSGSSAKRQKKRAGLQEMLARSKEQSGKRKAGDAQDGGGGLAAFLSGL